MPWFYVDDGFSDSKPVLNMPARHRLAACGLWVLAGSWSAKEETDGRVPEAKLRQLGARPALIDALTNESEFGAPLWSRVGREVQFNSWAKWQQTHAELVKKRADAAERQRESRSRKLKGRNYVASTNDEMSQCDSRVTHDVTETPVTHDVTRDPHARARGPDPTLPNVDTHQSTDVALVGGSGGKVAQPRGSRLPDDWMPDPDVVAQMRSDHPHVDLKAEHAKFCDYWHAKAGKDARKTDWNATWRNWVRRADEQQHAPATNGQHLSGVGKPTQKALGHAASAERIIAQMETT